MASYRGLEPEDRADVLALLREAIRRISELERKVDARDLGQIDLAEVRRSARQLGERVDRLEESLRELIEP